MNRLLLIALIGISLAGSASAQCCDQPAVSTAAPACAEPACATGGLFSGQLLNSLNAPLVAGLPAVPGVPTPSILGLFAPRLSFVASFVQGGGFAGPNATGLLLGLAAPRLAPLYALSQGTIQPGQALISTVSPRVGAVLPLVQGMGLGSRIGSHRACR